MLNKQLEEYSKSGIYPFHMPGHKRNTGFVGDLSLSHDMTEVSGLDDLHNADGILKEAMDNAAEFFGADRTFFLVNGSTCGILAAIAAHTKRGDGIVCARNCHRSVYNAVSLLGLKPEYVTPKIIPLPFGICGSVSPLEVEGALKKSGAKTVVITSPTYEGVISDIAEIAATCHKHNALLIVDEAHGAHLGHFKDFEQGAVKSGADIVIQSAHKTLGAVTQSALLHICGKMASAEKTARKLTVFETSSPSYLIMESIDSVIRTLQKRGEEYFSAYSRRLETFSKKAERLKNIDIMFYGKNACKKYDEIFAFDRSKLVISAARLGRSGAELAKLLLEKFKIQVEMAAANYIVAMTSYCDDDCGFGRLSNALQKIDSMERGSFVPKATALYCENERALELFEAEQHEIKIVSDTGAVGKICGEYVFAYPPGIPIIVPGEIISKRLLSEVIILKSSGIVVNGSISQNSGQTAVIDTDLEN